MSISSARLEFAQPSPVLSSSLSSSFISVFPPLEGARLAGLSPSRPRPLFFSYLLLDLRVAARILSILFFDTFFTEGY